MKRKDYELYEDSCEKIGIIRQETLTQHLHYHVEIVISLKGSFDAIVDGEKFNVSEGTGVIVFPYQLHEYHAVDSKEAIVLLMHPESNQSFFEYFKNYLPKSAHIPAELIDDEVRHAIDYIKRHGGWNSSGITTELASLYRRAIYALIIPRLELEEITGERLDQLRSVLHWCQEHFAEPITIPIAAKALMMSESQLSHLFSSRIRVGFRDYINSLRIQMAVELLRTTTFPISQIAFDVGFTNFSTFNRAFKQSTGQTPREVRSSGMNTFRSEHSTKDKKERKKERKNKMNKFPKKETKTL